MLPTQKLSSPSKLDRNVLGLRPPETAFVRDTLYTEHTTHRGHHLGPTLRRSADEHPIGTNVFRDPEPTHFHGLGIGDKTKE